MITGASSLLLLGQLQPQKVNSGYICATVFSWSEYEFNNNLVTDFKGWI